MSESTIYLLWEGHRGTSQDKRTMGSWQESPLGFRITQVAPSWNIPETASMGLTVEADWAQGDLDHLRSGTQLYRAVHPGV